MTHTDTNCAMKLAMKNATTVTVEAHERRHLELVDEAYMLADGIAQLERTGEKSSDLEEWDVYNTVTGESLLFEHESGFDTKEEATWAMQLAWLGSECFEDKYDVRKLTHIQRSQWIRINHKKFDGIMRRLRDNKNQLAHAKNMAHVK